MQVRYLSNITTSEVVTHHKLKRIIQKEFQKEKITIIRWNILTTKKPNTNVVQFTLSEREEPDHLEDILENAFKIQKHIKIEEVITDYNLANETLYQNYEEEEIYGHSLLY